MRGKLKVLFLVLLVVGMAAVAQANVLFPNINSTWSANYAATDSAITPHVWSPSMVASGDAQPFGGIDYYFVTQSNWQYLDDPKSFYLGSSDTALSVSNLTDSYDVFELGDVDYSWQYTELGKTAVTTATIKATDWGYWFASVYHQDAYVVKKVTAGDNTPPAYEVWLPGVGLLGDVDYYCDNAPELRVLNGYTVDMPAVPVPPSLVLLASGLVGLAGWKRYQRG